MAVTNGIGHNVSVQYNLTLIGAHTQNTSLSSAVSVTVPEGANAVFLNAQSQNVFYTLDGTAPTTTKGLMLKADNGSVMLPVFPGQTLKFIEASASAKLDYQFLKYGA